MITPTSWSRSEWLRRLGFKTGDMPPIAAAFTPTLASGDASELLPPLLAPQGWAGGTGYLPGAGNFSAWEIASRGIGGTFVTMELGTTHFISFRNTVAPTWIFNALKTVQEIVPGVTSTLSMGSVSAAITTSDARFSESFSTPIVNNFYVPPGSYLYIYAAVAAVFLSGAFLIRDVPVGNAGD